MRIGSSWRRALTDSVLVPASALVAAVAVAQVEGPQRTENPTLAPLFRAAAPAVVNIAVIGTGPVERDPIFDDPALRRFFDLPERDENGELTMPRHGDGSGVIVDAANGFTLTNSHLVEGADEIVVTLSDGRRFEATIVGNDPETDIALLKVVADRLTAMPIGDSDELEVGDFVVAIGNPFGLGQTLSFGIVSALGRTGLGIEGYEDFIQTDASLNPGSSGGALVDLDGRLVGINAAMISPGGGGNVGIGFAVPSNIAKSVMAQLLERGEVRRGRLGVTVQDLTPDLAAALDLDVAAGAVITNVEPGSSAERAGLTVGDVVTAMNGNTIVVAGELRARIGLVQPGDAVLLAVLRDGRALEVHVRLGGSPSPAPAPAPKPRTIDRLAGVDLANVARGRRVQGLTEGALVTSVAEESAAWRAGLRSGDVIVGINRKHVANTAEVMDAIPKNSKPVALNVMRNGTRLFIVIG